MSSRIYSIKTVDLALMKSKPPALQVTADGFAATSGWSNPILEPHVYVVPPSDGIQDCDFRATPPGPNDIVLQVLTPIRAELVLKDIDIDNYWGPGMPLVGFRCHAVANAKVALLAEDRPGMPTMRVFDTRTAAGTTSPGFESDIKPLFRLRDVNVMKAIRPMDLHNYDDVVDWADKILERLKTDDPNLLMPCDGKWPQTDIDLFEAWIAAGKPA